LVSVTIAVVIQWKGEGWIYVIFRVFLKFLRSVFIACDRVGPQTTVYVTIWLEHGLTIFKVLPGEGVPRMCML
jgi:hypothetical protein